MKPLLCLIGLHDIRHKEKWTPSIAARVVTGFEHEAVCARCGKTISHIRFEWNGSEMVEQLESGKTENS